MQHQQTEERRGHPRAKHPTEGTWRGASGGARCRIGDISLGGCFIFAQAMPIPGEQTVVTIADAGLELAYSGHVVYVELGMGFSVRFENLTPDQTKALERIVQTLAAAKASA